MEKAERRLDVLLVVGLVMGVGAATAMPSNDTVGEEVNTVNPEAGGVQAGLLYVTPQKKLKLPPSSLLIITPTLSVPQGRDLPWGFGASTTISVPFKVLLDELGMTSEANSWGLSRSKREAPPTHGDLAGGDREMLYKVVENNLATVGLDGRACLLRAICETAAFPLYNFGFLGEVLELFLSPARARSSGPHLEDYTLAEQEGLTRLDCAPYHEACPYSFFTDEQLQYAEGDASATREGL